MSKNDLTHMQENEKRYHYNSEVAEVNKMNNSKLKGIAVILFGILLSTSSAEINRTVLASFGDFPFALIGIIFGIVGLIMVFKNNKE